MLCLSTCTPPDLPPSTNWGIFVINKPWDQHVQYLFAFIFHVSYVHCQVCHLQLIVKLLQCSSLRSTCKVLLFVVIMLQIKYSWTSGEAFEQQGNFLDVNSAPHSYAITWTRGTWSCLPFHEAADVHCSPSARLWLQNGATQSGKWVPVGVEGFGFLPFMDELVTGCSSKWRGTSLELLLLFKKIIEFCIKHGEHFIYNFQLMSTNKIGYVS